MSPSLHEMIILTNTIRFNQNLDDFVTNPQNRYRSFTEKEQAIPSEILERIAKKEFKDEPLLKSETILLKTLFERKIKGLLTGRETLPYGNPTISFLGEKINLDISPIRGNPQDNFIRILYTAYQICEECLQENKPVYLSITKDNV